MVPITSHDTQCFQLSQKLPRVLWLSISSFPDPWQALWFLPLWFCFVENFKYSNHPVCSLASKLLSLCIIHLSFIHAVTCISNSFSLLNEYPCNEYPFLYGWTVLLWPVAHLNCFQFLSIMSTVAVSSQVQAFVWTCVFTSLGKYPSSGIAGSCGKHTLCKKKKQKKKQPNCVTRVAVYDFSLQ